MNPNWSDLEVGKRYKIVCEAELLGADSSAFESLYSHFDSGDVKSVTRIYDMPAVGDMFLHSGRVFKVISLYSKEAKYMTIDLESHVNDFWQCDADRHWIVSNGRELV